MCSYFRVHAKSNACGTLFSFFSCDFSPAGLCCLDALIRSVLAVAGVGIMCLSRDLARYCTPNRRECCRGVFSDLAGLYGGVAVS